MTPYPTKLEIRSMFAPLSFEMSDGVIGHDFHLHFVDDAEWTVLGHHPLAGRYTSKQAVIRSTFQRLSNIMKGPIRLVVENVVGGGEEDQAVVELKMIAVCKNGLDFVNQYVWVIKFNMERQIVQVHAYPDSALIKRALEENE
ncbi:hypothetical protein C8R44DRAFT_900856 [Mycena epipterygia]|nr:hypothetical protein C8R44DRAFT_900856 [Mycena epipterygia]